VEEDLVYLSSLAFAPAERQQRVEAEIVALQLGELRQELCVDQVELAERLGRQLKARGGQ